jgi:predicted small metal-binding protein
MKTLTCSQLGGPCEEAVTATTQDEMMSKGMAHLESAHPDMAEKVKSTPKDDPMMVSWMEKFQTDWDNAPDTAEVE